MYLSKLKKYYDVPVYIAGNYNNQYIIDMTDT